MHYLIIITNYTTMVKNPQKMYYWLHYLCMFDEILYKIFSYVHILIRAIKKNFVREEKKIRK
jgi:hypothetical protein